MRVTDSGTRISRNERGAVVVIVAVCAVVLFGFTAYAIDAGNLWQTRRHITTAADASSLAAASDFALDTDGCDASAADYLDRNLDGSALELCEHTATSDHSGYVTVKGGTTAEYTFAGIFGIESKDVHAVTTSEYGLPTSVSGLRPFGLCLQANTELQTWLNLPHGPTGESAPITIVYGKEHPDACGTNAPGNWGVLDFDGGANSNADTVEWTHNGYPDEVWISPPEVLGDTGAFSNSIDAELAYLQAQGEFFPLPVFDSVIGSGSNATFNIVAFVNVKLVDFKTTGPQASRYFTLIFDNGILSGRCCGNGIDTGVRVVRICDFDALSPNTTDSRAC